MLLLNPGAFKNVFDVQSTKLIHLEDADSAYRFPSSLAISGFYYFEMFANLINGK